MDSRHQLTLGNSFALLRAASKNSATPGDVRGLVVLVTGQWLLEETGSAA
ncbi:MAG TPA: hypothetical protein QGF35_02870 [Dehalococcoidia bacterium]|nr:hypothetical protein [Dehalococcoidia bacterium]